MRHWKFNDCGRGLVSAYLSGSYRKILQEPHQFYWKCLLEKYILQGLVRAPFVPFQEKGLPPERGAYHNKNPKGLPLGL